MHVLIHTHTYTPIHEYINIRTFLHIYTYTFTRFPAIPLTSLFHLFLIPYITHRTLPLPAFYFVSSRLVSFSRNISSLHILTKPLTLTPIFLIIPRCPTWSTGRVLRAFFRSVLLHPTMSFYTPFDSLILTYIMFHSPPVKHHYHRTSMLSCLPSLHNALLFLVRPSLFRHFPEHNYLFPVSPPLDIKLWIWYTCVIFGYLSEPLHSTQVRTHIRLSVTSSLLAKKSIKCQVTTNGCW